MRFFLLIIGLSITANAQTLRYSVQLPSPAGATRGAVEQVFYDGKGGCAFIVGYQNSTLESVTERLFWLNAKRQLATTDFEPSQAPVIRRVTPKALILTVGEQQLTKATRDATGMIRLAPFGVSGELFDDFQSAFDPVGFFTVGHGAPFIPVTLNRYSN